MASKAVFGYIIEWNGNIMELVPWGRGKKILCDTGEATFFWTRGRASREIRASMKHYKEGKEDRDNYSIVRVF